ncbi:FAD/FMN_dependent oxidoreductase [Hexamita inflata]|uniref:FAD/FMN dependent oxidoreductase n=1 Tax=Hexamita inflata TaxID=28002 RepID=A0AA86R162_9EUKA|nr:FAD/FMN dependent oxidoreductase [Hexamita inflata]
MFNKLSIANFEIENRSVRAATATGNCDKLTGIPDQQFYDIYESLSRGHVGFVIFEHAFVSLRGKADHNQLGIHDDSMTQYHAKINRIMRAANDKIRTCCQLAHAGAACSVENKIDLNSASVQELQEVVQQYTNAAIRAKNAGYDCIQIHASNPFLLGQSISPQHNSRTDSYNAQDFKLLRQVLESVSGILPVGVKIQCDGLSAENTSVSFKLLNEFKFHFVEITGSNQIAPVRTKVDLNGDQYYNQKVIKKLKQMHFNQPIIITGGFQTVEGANIALNDGADMVGFSRKFLRNDKFLIDGDQLECKKCNQCFKNLFDYKESCCVSKQAKII